MMNVNLSSVRHFHSRSRRFKFLQNLLRPDQNESRRNQSETRERTESLGRSRKDAHSS